MPSRISRQSMFMGMARIASQRATCFRLNVGAMVVQHNNPIAIGWNGAPSGAPHCAGNDCPGVVPGNCGTLHAEHNALLKAELVVRGSGDTTGLDLYVTHSPCIDCCEYIRTGSGLTVHRLFFEVPYRNTSHLGMLQVPSEDDLFKGCAVYEVTPAGYTVEYFTRKVVEL